MNWAGIKDGHSQRERDSERVPTPARANRMNRPRHLPYEIDSTKNRFHYYETLWEQRGLELLARHLSPKGQSILDYGCGRGEALRIFSEAGYRMTGTDADPECVRLSSEHGSAVLLNT